MNFIPSNGWPQLKDIPEKLEHFREVYARFAKINKWYQSIKETELTGNPVIFEKALKLNATALSLAIVPIQSGTGDPSPTNIRPISGRTEVNLGRTGKNLLPMTLERIKASNTAGTWSGNVYTINGGTFTIVEDDNGNITEIKANGTFTADSNLYIINGGNAPTFTANQYILSGVTGGSSNTFNMLYASANWGWQILNDGEAIMGMDVVRVRLNAYTGTVNNIVFYPMIRDAAETDPTFAPYKGSVTLTIALGQTVYGGTLDVKTGVGTVTDGYIASYDGETLPSSWISDRDVYAEGTTPTTGAEVVYKLATPTTIQLTGEELEMLKGYNYFSTDADSLTVKAYTI